VKLQTVSFRTRLQAGAEQEYERVHAVIPPALDVALRAAGVRGWRIWRDGLDLFHVVEAEDFEEMERRLADDPANVAWHATIDGLLEPGEVTTFGLVWELPPAVDPDADS
jgi:L-rhamnose mutarotase